MQWLLKIVYAQGQGNPDQVDLGDLNPFGKNCTDLSCVIQNVAKFLNEIAIPIVVLFILWGAFQILSAGGDSAKVSNGKKTIQYAIMGYAVIFFAGVIIPLIKSILTGGGQ